MTDVLWTATEALDAAFLGSSCDAVSRDGLETRLPTGRWIADADVDDHALFVDRCSGPTLDVGCGPGRLTGALAALDLTALGIDVSREAVRQTRSRGAEAMCGNVFSSVPDEGTWRHALLADGNIGIGGAPVRLLRRVRELLHHDGTALVEIDGPGTDVVHDRVRLRVDGRMSHSFGWSTVGADGIGRVAESAGFVVAAILRSGGRHVAELRARPPAGQ